MSLKKNIIANYVSQLYVTGIGILILPLYIKYMGAEAYGLVGFFAMLQAFFTLLDLGLTVTISRETARFYGGAITNLAYRQLFRSLSLIFFSIAIIGGSSLLLSSNLVATQWLGVEEIPIGEVVLSVKVMAISVALRWVGGLYRGVITGAEKLTWLACFNVFVATMRFIFVFISMWLFGFSPTVFFIHQLIVALLEVIGLILMGYRLLPSISEFTGGIGWSFKPVKPILKFALVSAFTSAVWVFVTQTDKLILSGILSLTEYGSFTLAVLVAGGVMTLSGPISSAIIPRMTRLYAEGRRSDLINVYRKGTQLVSVVAGSTALVIAFLAEPLLYAWTGDVDITLTAAPILKLYAIGNCCLIVAAFPYYLQYALGNLRYHLIGNIVMIIMLIPAIIYAAKNYGGLGAGYVWFIINALYLIIWVAYVHHKLEPGLHRKWILSDVIYIYGPVIMTLYIINMIDFGELSRLGSLSLFMVSSFFAISVGGLAASSLRNSLFSVMSNVRR